MDNLKFLKNTADEIESAIDKYLPLQENPQKTIYEAMRYSVLGGGKRLRGVLVKACCLLAGGNPDEAMPFAAAIEMVHAYSLVHDDLPAMDNDDMRRGKPTNHLVYGEAMAILAGDGLLGYAFETVLKNAKPGENTWKALEILALAAGPSGMIGGQVVDMESENKKIDYDTLVYLQNHKTGALIEAACLIGATVAGADDRLIEKLRSYAGKIGLAFQVKDDILDVTGDEKLLGKPTGSDSESNKSTFVTECGVEKAQMLVEKLTREAVAEAADINEYGDFLSWLAQYLAGQHFPHLFPRKYPCRRFDLLCLPRFDGVLFPKPEAARACSSGPFGPGTAGRRAAPRKAAAAVQRYHPQRSGPHHPG